MSEREREKERDVEREGEKEGESKGACMCVRERDGERQRKCVRMCGRDVCLCVCCVCERESEREREKGRDVVYISCIFRNRATAIVTGASARLCEMLSKRS